MYTHQDGSHDSFDARLGNTEVDVYVHRNQLNHVLEVLAQLAKETDILNGEVRDLYDRAGYMPRADAPERVDPIMRTPRYTSGRLSGSAGIASRLRA